MTNGEHRELTFGEVLVHDIEAFLVNVQVLVVLQVVNSDLLDYQFSSFARDCNAVLELTMPPASSI